MLCVLCKSAVVHYPYMRAYYSGIENSTSGFYPSPVYTFSNGVMFSNSLEYTVSTLTPVESRIMQTIHVYV